MSSTRGVAGNRNALLTLDSWLRGHPHEPDPICEVSCAPFAHLSGRCEQWRGTLCATTRTLCADPRELPAALLDARPTCLVGPPQVWQALKAKLEATLAAHEHAALSAGIARARALAAGNPLQPLDAEQERMLAALRARIGLDRVNRAQTVAAPCPSAVHEFMHGLGLPFSEFYAMTQLASRP